MVRHAIDFSNTFGTVLSYRIIFLDAQGDVPNLETSVSTFSGFDGGNSAGDIVFVNEVTKGSRYNEKQRVLIRSNESFTNGSFALNVHLRQDASGSLTAGHLATRLDASFETEPIPYNADAARVRAALENLPGVGVVRVRRILFNNRTTVLFPTSTSPPTSVPTTSFRFMPQQYPLQDHRHCRLMTRPQQYRHLFRLILRLLYLHRGHRRFQLWIQHFYQHFCPPLIPQQFRLRWNTGLNYSTKPCG